jgi:hypothetical protein
VRTHHRTQHGTAQHITCTAQCTQAAYTEHTHARARLYTRTHTHAPAQTHARARAQTQSTQHTTATRTAPARVVETAGSDSRRTTRNEGCTVAMDGEVPCDCNSGLPRRTANGYPRLHSCSICATVTCGAGGESSGGRARLRCIRGRLAVRPSRIQYIDRSRPRLAWSDFGLP